MIRRYAFVFRLVLAAVDAAAAAIALTIASNVRFGSGDSFQPLASVVPNPIFWLGAYLVGWPATLWFVGLYRPRARLTVRREAFDAIRAAVVYGFIVVGGLFALKSGDFSRSVLLVTFTLLAGGAIASRVVIHRLLVCLRARGRNTRFVLVLGTAEHAQAYADMVEAHASLGLSVIGHLGTDGDPVSVTRPVLGSIEEIELVLHANVVDEVAICLPVSQWDRIDAIARLCEDEGKIVRIPMYMMEHSLSRGRVEEFAGVPIYSIVTGPDRVAGLAAKRVMDLVGSLLLLVLLSPAVAVLAVLIKADSPGPVYFLQRRVGLHGRSFTIVKFRTMSAGAEGLLGELESRNEVKGHAFKLSDDPRVTRVGRWLRRTSLDELPQLWNVLRGEMSLVGPRPPLPSEVADYDIWHRRRLSMKPGMTGLWQVRARREPEFDRWVELDLEYIDAWSLWLDLKIIARTVPAVLDREGR